ncbi:DHA2 family efflux MFS transporter permease subunit [Nocardioides KLBMP 9356]|uniref:DHA2 family efflux MFS transporter permease subunit n=1 Tax=Nocardioides potassii TaxID=2911371 RepID=A0ABS9HDQ8_9ACTN|nr:MDR family MFS transporter/patatin-like phospholipase family protein [Nocardioides potassii]MCF6378261.1 DHA2 family efflux MFS transporter permease subunit [Nocardioides potassii]
MSAFGAFLAFLDATIVNVAFPSIRESFPGTSIGGLSWVLNAYNIVFAAFLIVFGRLTDLLGRRRAFITGVLVFTVASALCGAAPTLELLVASRVLQALGAALLVPASLALVVEAFPEQQRAHAIGLWGATAAVAAGLGPPLGGALVELGGWRWAFFVNLPFGLVAFWVARSQLVESRAPGVRRIPDLRGAILLIFALAALNLGIVRGNDWGWTSSDTVLTLAVSAVLLVLFVLSSRAHRSPLLDPALLRIPSFGIASLGTVVAGVGFYAYLLTNILWLQYVWGYTVLEAGLALVPGAVVAAVVAARLGPLADRHGYRTFVVPGAAIWAGAYLWYHQQVGVTPAFWEEWLPGQVISGIGVGATLPLLGSAALAAVPGARYATASALMSSARQLGGVLGIAVLVVILDDPTPATAVDAFRDGWMLSIGAFLVVAVLALPLGRIRTPVEEATEDDSRPATVHPPLAVEAGPSMARTEDAAGDLSGVPMLAALPTAARRRLELASRHVVVPAGHWLIRAGDPPGSAYVVRRGRLEVTVGAAVVRELGPGEVIGELALLTGERRSASVRAKRDSTVLEVPRPEFEEVLAADPDASRTMLSQMAERLRTAGGPTGERRATRPTVVSVVALHDGTGAGDVAHTLVRRMSETLRVSAPGVVDPEGLDRAERGHDRVVLVSDDAASATKAWRDFCIRQADLVVLVGRSDGPVPSAPLDPAPGAGPEVVLAGGGVDQSRCAAWAAATDAWQVSVVDGDLAAGLRPLADRLSGRSLGLTLAGGGARAFAHVGVLRELEESGLHVDRVAGSSVGAIIAALHATGRDGAEIEELCYAEFVRRRPFSDWTVPTHSLARGRRMHDGLVRAFGDSVIEGLPRQLHVVSTDLVTRQRQVHRRGSLVQAVQASACLPVLLPPVPDDDGRLLVDGGILDNLPVDLLTERDEGPVAAISISMGGGAGSGTPRTGRPRVPALGETLLRTMMIGSGGAVATARARGAWVVTPPTRGVGLLEFHQLDRMIEAGRSAARTLLEQAGGDLGGYVAREAEDEAPAPYDTSETG